MKRLDRLLHRFASNDDRALLEGRPGFRTRLLVSVHLARRYIWAFGIVVAIALIATVASGMDIYHRTEMPRFCRACHEMSPNFASWERSVHQKTKCVDCHARPGLSGWAAAKASGLRQLFSHFRAKSTADIKAHMGDHHKALVEENCKRCHRRAARIKEKKTVAVAHKRHLDVGLNCIECHSRAIAHPAPRKEGKQGKKENPLFAAADCHACHDGKHRRGKAVAFSATEEARCTKCHLDAKAANSHGGDDHKCTDCHEAQKGRHYAYADKPVREICAKCHDTAETTYASAHKAVGEGRCGDCHQVMSPTHLYKTASAPSANGCLSCHRKLAALLKGRPEKLVSSFSDGDDDLHVSHAGELGKEAYWCKRCHEAHGSDATVGLVSFRRAKDEKEGAASKQAFTASKDGGQCKTACHEDDTMEYTRRAKQVGAVK